MSHIASTWAWAQDIKNARHKLMLLKLADSANDDGVCWPSLRTMASHTGISKSALSRIARELEKANLVTIRETLKSDGSRGANVYTLHMEGVPTDDNTSSRLGDNTSSHPDRSRTVKEPSKEPSKPRAASAAPPTRLGDLRWSVPSSRQGKGPFVVQFPTEGELGPPTCTCENRAASECRHIRAARVAEEKWQKAWQRELLNAVWDKLVDAFGQPSERQRTGYGSVAKSIKERLLAEGIEATPVRFGDEVASRYAALVADWGIGRVTLNAFGQNWHLAGKLARGENIVRVDGKNGGDDPHDFSRFDA